MGGRWYERGLSNRYMIPLVGVSTFTYSFTDFFERDLFWDLSLFSLVKILNEYLFPERAFVSYDWGGLKNTDSSFGFPCDFASGNFCWISFKTRGQRIVLNKLTLPSYVDCMNWKTVSQRSSIALGLYFVFTLKQAFITSERRFEYTTGIGSKYPWLTFLLSEGKSLAKKGGRKAAISYKRQPKDQMSHFPSYGTPFQISGLV